MPPLPRRRIETSLAAKGFVVDPRDRRFWYLHYGGRKTQIRTKISTGTKHRAYGDSLINQMRYQLHFDAMSQLHRFIDCPMSAKEYLTFLISKGVIVPEEGQNSQRATP